MNTLLQTERLSIRPWSIDDAEAAFVIYSDPAVNRYIGGRTVTDVDQVRRLLARWIKRSRQHPQGMGYFAAWQSNVLVGTAILKPLPASGHPPHPDPDLRVLSDDIEVGWHLGQAWWGQGYATEMGRALVTHGFDTLGIDAIHAVVEAGNVPSMRVAERCGLTHTGATSAYYDLTLEHFLKRRPE